MPVEQPVQREREREREGDGWKKDTGQQTAQELYLIFNPMKSCVLLCKMGLSVSLIHLLTILFQISETGTVSYTF